MNLSHRPNGSSWVATLPMILITAAAVFFVWQAESGVKPLDGDSVCFVPVATNLASQQGWTNSFYHPAEVADPAYPEKFTWHGFVAPKLWSILAPTPDFNGARISGVIWATIGLVCLGFAVAKQQSRFNALVPFAMLGAAWLFTHNGRPEAIAAMLVAATLLVLPREMNTRWHLIAGVGLGVIGATTPAAAALIAPWIVIAIGLARQGTKEIIVGVVTVAVVSVAVTLTLVCLTGCGPALWIKSMALHSKNVVWNRADGTLGAYWLRSTECPLLAFVVLLLAFCGWSVVCKSKLVASIPIKLGMAAALVFFCLLSYRIAIRPTACYYNFFPLFVALVVVAAQVSSRRMRIVFAVAMLFPSIGLVRSAMMCYSATHTGLSRSVAAAQLKEDLQTLHVPHPTLGLTGGLFELADVPRVTALHPLIVAGTEQDPCNILVVQQANRGLLEAPTVAGFHRVTNHFDGHKPALAALGLAKTTGSYAFAVYVRDGSEQKNPTH